MRTNAISPDRPQTSMRDFGSCPLLNPGAARRPSAVGPIRDRSLARAEWPVLFRRANQKSGLGRAATSAEDGESAEREFVTDATVAALEWRRACRYGRSFPSGGPGFRLEIRADAVAQIYVCDVSETNVQCGCRRALPSTKKKNK